MNQQASAENNREKVLSALEEYHKAAAAQFFWQEKLKTMELVQEINADLTQAEKDRFIKARTYVIDNLERNQ